MVRDYGVVPGTKAGTAWHERRYSGQDTYPLCLSFPIHKTGQ